MSWKTEVFTALVEDITGGNQKYLTSEYSLIGKYPIVDQGVGLIAGYTNENQVVKRKKPVVIFGDHTKNVKYVDFDFCLGADGVKVLETSDTLDPKFFYHYLGLQKLPNAGYSRHFKFLKEIRIPIPPLTIQKQITDILDKADALRKKDLELLNQYDALAQSLFIDMFGDPVKNEMGWEMRKLEELSEISSGGTPSRSKSDYYSGDINWVKTGEVNGKVILSTDETITESGLKNSSCKLYPINSIIIAMYGQGKTRGQVGLLGVQAATNQACGVIKPSHSYNSHFLYSYLKLSYQELRKLGRGGNQENLNAGMIKNFVIIYPPISLQNQFATQIQNIELQKEKVKAQIKASENLFQSLLQKAFNGGL